MSQNVLESLKSFDTSMNNFDKEEAAHHTLTLLKEHPQLCDDGFDCDDAKSPMHQKTQHFKDLNPSGQLFWKRSDALFHHHWEGRPANAIFQFLI
jgi:hypothetical protein